MSDRENSYKNININRRIKILGYILSIIVICLGIKLFKIMVIDNDYALQGVNGQIHKSIICYDGFDFKSSIFDRNLKKLTNNGVEYKAIIDPEMVWRKIPSAEGQYKEIFNLIDKSTNYDLDEDIEVKIEKEYRGNQKAIILTIGDDIKDTIIRSNLPGIYVKEELKKFGDNVGLPVISNFINNTVNNKDLKYHNSIDMKVFNYIARYGRHVLVIPVDARGSTMPGYSIIEDIEYDGIAQSTKDVMLTIDYSIQKAAEETLDKLCKNSGAISVIDIKTGEVLAMASKDANGWERNMVTYSGKNYAYNPGSIFKIIVLAAALEEGEFDINTQFLCSGKNEATGISCYKSGGHGLIGLEDAFASSCNVYFIELAMSIGSEKIINMAKKFGFGEKVLNFSRESRGLLYRNINDIKYDVGNIAIGQKDIMITPLQACDMICTIANNGVRNKPFILKEVLNSDGSTYESYEAEKQRIISEKTAKIIQKLLKLTVDRGTGKKAQIPAGAAGKTGTPQRGGKTSDGDYQYEDGWFTGYFPQSNPEFGIAVYVEDIGNQGNGGDVASPIFKDLAKKILFMKSEDNSQFLD